MAGQTSQHEGVWGDFHFTEEAVQTSDYVLILNNLDRELQTRCPQENIWRIVQEPPIDRFKTWHINPSYAFKSFTCDPGLSGRHYVRSQPMLPWHVNRDYDFLKAASIPNKIKDLSWITSTKEIFEGHRKRMLFLREVSGKLESLDLLGGGIYHMSNSEAGRRNEALQKSLGFLPIVDKWAGLAPYKYSLAVENAIVPDYWSEKIADCFLAWAVPIYFGCPNMEDYFPKDSFIRIDIGNPEEAIEIINQSLKKDSWEARLPALNEARNLILERYQLFPAVAHHINALTGNKR